MEEDDPFLRLLKDSVATAKGGVPNFGTNEENSLPQRGSLDDLIDSNAYEVPYAGPIEGDAEAEIREVKGVIRLVIDPSNIDHERRVAMSGEMDSILQDSNGFPLAPASGIAEAVKGQSGKEYVDDIVNFYKGKFLLGFVIHSFRVWRCESPRTTIRWNGGK